MCLERGAGRRLTSFVLGVSLFHSPCGRGLCKTSSSAKSFEKIANQGVEIAVLFSLIFHLANRVDDRRLMFAAEAAAYLRQRRVGQRLAQIHRDSAWFRDRL